MENWHVIEPYEVSDHGNVRLSATKEPVKVGIDSIGYPCISKFTMKLYGKSFIRVHRLVAESFLPNPENKKEVNHIDGNRANNHVSNLEWSTHKENMRHAVETGLNWHFGEKHVWNRLKLHEVKEIWKLKHVYGLSHRLIAGLYNISHQHVSCIARQHNCWKGIDFELSL